MITWKLCILLLLPVVWAKGADDNLESAAKQAREVLVKMRLKRIYPAKSPADRERNEWYDKIEELRNQRVEDFGSDSLKLKYLWGVYTTTKLFQQHLEENVKLNEKIGHLRDVIHRMLSKRHWSKHVRSILQNLKLDLMKIVKEGDLSRKRAKIDFVESYLISLPDR